MCVQFGLTILLYYAEMLQLQMQFEVVDVPIWNCRFLRLYSGRVGFSGRLSDFAVEVEVDVNVVVTVR